MLNLHSKELLRIAREMIKETKTDPYSLNTFTNIFEAFQKSKINSVAFRTEVEQELYTGCAMVLNLYNFEINDMIRAAYWLTKSNYNLNKSTINKISKSICTSSKFVTKESWFMALNLLSTFRQNIDMQNSNVIIRSIETIFPPSSEWAVQGLFDLCCLGEYSNATWKNLISGTTDKNLENFELLKVIRYAVLVEGQESIGRVVKTALDIMINDIKKPDIKQKLNIGMLSVNKIYREVDFVLKEMLGYEKNYNVDDVYFIDFFNKDLNIGFDIVGTDYYLAQDVYDKQQIIDEDAVVPWIRLKQHLLKKRRYRIASIPFYEWSRYPDLAEKKLYLKRKIRLLNK